MHMSQNVSHILYIIIVNKEEQVSGVGLIDQIADHHIPYCYISDKPRKVKTYKREIWRYQLGDYEELRHHLSTLPLLQVVQSEHCIDKATDEWTTLFMAAARKHIPNSIVTIRQRYKPWITSDIKKLLRRKNRCSKRWRRTRLDYHHEIYRNVRRQTNEAIKEAKDQYNSDLISKLSSRTTSAKEYWRLNSKLLGRDKKKTQTPLSVNNEIVSDSKDKAEHFCEYFASQSSAPVLPDNCVPPLLTPRDDPVLDTIVIIREDMKRIIEKLNPNKANGADNISNRLLKETKEAIAPL